MSQASTIGPEPEFHRRHLGLTDVDRAALCEVVGVRDTDQLVVEALPADIRFDERLDVAGGLSEADVLQRARELASLSRPRTSLIGMGYYGTHTPAVIQRSILENPSWYTAYTPYQPEISQGRLEMLLNFQTLVSELTGLDLANASLLDEATAAAEAMVMCRRGAGADRVVFMVDADTHPQTLAVLRTRAEPIGIEIRTAEDLVTANLDGVFGLLVSYPGSSGAIRELEPVISRSHEAGAKVIVASDLLALMVLVAPGHLGADIAIGSAQRFGVPMFAGGPHAAFIACREELARSLPGRLVGVSTDTQGRPALRLALQTREQHIRRERATSNVCTAQALLAVTAAAYAMWHGPDGLRAIAERVASFTDRLVEALGSSGYRVHDESWFDTVTIDVDDAASLHRRARERGLDLREVSPTSVGVSFDETTTEQVFTSVLEVFGLGPGGEVSPPSGIPQWARRRDRPLPQRVFHRFHSEHEMLRELRRLSDRDLALDRTMIPLGSCTMKLNATVEMMPVTWPEFAQLHPFAPADESVGLSRIVDELCRDLLAITGYDAVSLQPNAGSQGEFAGLLAIRAYHQSRGDDQRRTCLIPTSAHGTNAASAVMAGMNVVPVATNDRGDVDLDDLRRRIAEAGDTVAAIMVTYPSTHGVFEPRIAEVCAAVHDAGGQVYVDGANLNALVGIARPGKFGADVSHLNLHKTFCIPHGGGGPGVGPVAVRSHLAAFLPGDPLDATSGVVGPVSAAPLGSAGILVISWAYLRLMGAEGLRRATHDALLSANYLAHRLEPFFPVLYRGPGGFVAHELILDLREITKSTGVTVDDVAKRLIDHGFHAPTVNFPVTGTLMVEPTESESWSELERFVDAMAAIRGEIDSVTEGRWNLDDSPLRHAPHTAADLLGDWDRPYPRLIGAFPDGQARSDKYFPPVSRIDAAYGDRNLMCSCEPLDALSEVTS